MGEYNKGWNECIIHIINVLEGMKRHEEEKVYEMPPPSALTLGPTISSSSSISSMPQYSDLIPADFTPGTGVLTQHGMMTDGGGRKRRRLTKIKRKRKGTKKHRRR